MAGDVHGPREAGRRRIQQPALQVGLGREGHRVHQHVELAPLLGDPLEQRLLLASVLHVERHQDRRAHRFGQRRHMRIGLVVEIGDRELGAKLAKGPRAAPRDGFRVGHADHQHARAQQWGIGYLHHDVPRLVNARPC